MFKIDKSIEIPSSIFIEDGMRLCTVCNEVQNFDQFYIDQKGNFCSRCKKCNKNHNKKYRIDNKNKMALYQKEYSQTEKGKEILKAGVSRYRKTGKGKITRKKSWDKYNIKRLSTSKGKINNAISCGMRDSLRYGKEGKHWESLVNFTLEELIEHLENQFEIWMSWMNYGNDIGCWSIDHIKPISSFNFNSYEDEEFKKCWNLNNLRPLDHIENINKGDKLI